MTTSNAKTERTFSLQSGAWYFTPEQLEPGTFDCIIIQAEAQEFTIVFSHDGQGKQICQIRAFDDGFQALAACTDLITAMADLFTDEVEACPFVITGFMEDHLLFTDITPTDAPAE